MADTVIGLEITQDRVLAAEVRLSRRRPVLHRYGQVPLPAGVANDSEALDPGAVGDAITRLWQSAKLSRRASVVLGLDSWRVLVRDFSSPLTSLPRIIESLPFEVKDLLPVSVDKATMDFVPTRVDEDGTHGLLVVAGAQSIDDLLGATSQAKVMVERVDLVAFALSRLARVLATKDETVAMLRVGRRTTVMAIVRQGVPLFVRMLPAEIHLGAGTTPLLGIPADPSPQSDAALENLRDLSTRLRGTLDFYAARPDSVPIDRLMVSGAASHHDALLPMFSESLAAPMERIDPASFIRIRRHVIAPELMQDLIGTMSLALGGHR